MENTVNVLRLISVDSEQMMDKWYVEVNGEEVCVQERPDRTPLFLLQSHPIPGLSISDACVSVLKEWKDTGGNSFWATERCPHGNIFLIGADREIEWVEENIPRVVEGSLPLEPLPRLVAQLERGDSDDT